MTSSKGAHGQSNHSSAPPSVGDRLQVRIEKLAIGGAGIARADGFVLFVDLAVPGDELTVEVTSSKGRHGEARIVEILTPGESRRTPPCSYADRCGGCNWQQIADAEQLHQKDLLLRETFAKFLPGRNIPFEPFVPSPKSLRYRNRVQPRMKNGRLGYYRRKSHEFLPVDDCLITEEALAVFFKNPPKISLDQETRVELRLSQDNVPQWSVQGREEAEGFSFSQVNRFQNQDLIETVLRWGSN
ncbi:MAG TPA: TRAM domain-containing protein, partial [Pseudobdellovibrionaceae bacterium]|nr:TRAM domain-containing protein [Pseudobdellovibrionaceae bacterium]